jgi:hypothetical protein
MVLLCSIGHIAGLLSHVPVSQFDDVLRRQPGAEQASYSQQNQIRHIGS